MSEIKRTALPPDSRGPRRLGRHIEHDERSRAFPFTAPAPTPSRSVLWGMTDTVLHQKLNACTGNAAAHCLNTDLFRPVRRTKNYGKLFVQDDAVRIYSLATRHDEFPGTYPPTDKGSSGLGVAKACRRLGYITRYTHCFSFDQFLTAVESQPVLVGTFWTRDMNRPDPAGLVRPGPLTAANRVGGHEYLCRGVDYENRLLRFRNSWGSRWGKAGELFIGFDDFATLLKADGDATVLQGVTLP
jgi:hypothetical protein